MKEKLYQKLITTRDKFLKSDIYKDYDGFSVLVKFVLNENKIFITLESIAFRNVEKKGPEDILIIFNEEIIGELYEYKEEFENFVEDCFTKYDGKVSFLSNDIIDLLYGKGMNIDKFLTLVDNFIEHNYNYLFSGIGFMITEKFSF